MEVSWVEPGGDRLDELVGEEVHQQVVVPRVVGAALVLAHDADGPEADLAVRADGGRIASAAVDRW